MKKDFKNIILITIIFLLLAILNFSKTGNILIDFSRESYLSYAINQGYAPFKDYLTIYGAFGYIFNSLLYKFSNNVNILLILANIISYFIVFVFYFISRQFLNRKESALLTIFICLVNVFSYSTFSFVYPYSFSTLWAYLASYILLLALLKKKENISFILLGFILINRIELFFPLLIVSFLYLKPQKKLKNLLYLTIFPIILGIYFLFNKINLNDILNNIFYINKMLETKALSEFYKNVGVYFNLEFFIFNLKNIIIFAIISGISYILYKKTKPYISYIFALLALNIAEIATLFNLIIIFLIGNIFYYVLKKKKISPNTLLLVSFSIILAIKSILVINWYNYSNFACPIVLLCLYFLYKKITNKKWLFNFVLIILISISISNFKYLSTHKKEKINTSVGNIYINENEKENFVGIVDYLNKNLKKDETFVVVPEGLIFNQIFNKIHPYYYTTLTPLDFETFSEEKIINDTAKIKPDYIIFYPRNTKEYGANTICYDYGVNFCIHIINNYSRVAIIKGQYSALIFKRIK